MKDTTESYIEYANKFIQWGTDRYICGPEGQGTAVGQAKKCVEESAELLLAVAEKDDAGIVDGIGDTFVTMVMVSERMGVNPEIWIEKIDIALHPEQDPANMAKFALAWAGELILSACRKDCESVIATLSELWDCLIHVAAMHNLTMVECMEAAWVEIKDRKGRMVNGKFVKEAA